MLLEPTSARGSTLLPGLLPSGLARAYYPCLMASDDRRPHVVMLVANDVSNDTRVKKEALAVSAMGLDVTILGMASEKHPGDSRMGPVRITRVPIAFENRERHRLRRRKLRTLPRPLRSPRTPIRQFR